jgi:hypothetical protein
LSTLSHTFTRKAWKALGGHPAAADRVVFINAGGVPSAFPVADFASAAYATAALSVAELLRHRAVGEVSVTVDRRLASIWFWASIRPIGWKPRAVRDPVTGDYQARDGWIRLHANAAHHRAAAEHVLGVQGDKDAVASAVAGWSKGELEAAIIEAGGCAAEMRTQKEWAVHPQGVAVAVEPLVSITTMEAGGIPDWPVPPDRPLTGLCVLDLTRVLAGPIASRFLASYGANVLRIDPPDWDEPGVVPEVSLGKKCARLDLRRETGRACFTELLASADILLHGYRPGALERLGFGTEKRRGLAPGLIDVCLSAYGWSGPWAGRRGFDSLVQMSSGIAETGMNWRHSEKPVPLPYQALDHATGYLMAAAAIRGITQRLQFGNGTAARLSLARTAKFLTNEKAYQEEPPFAPETEADRSPAIEVTEWGNAQRVIAPVAVSGAEMRWDRPACSLGSAKPSWR